MNTYTILEAIVSPGRKVCLDIFWSVDWLLGFRKMVHVVAT